MNAYRRRFVAFTMALIGIVLLILFVLLGIYMHRHVKKELENTMRLVIEPWGEHYLGLRAPDGYAPGPPPGVKPEDMPEHPDQKGEFEPREHKHTHFNTEGVELVFYNIETDELSLLNSELADDSERIYAAVHEMIEKKANYGTLRDYGLIYRYERINPSYYKIALADTSFILSRTANNALSLLGGFAAAMVLFFFVSCYLSKIAVKPMEEAIEMERQFVTDISHDLKTPVTVVLANNSILRSNAESSVADQLQWVDSTDAAAKNMMALVNSMLELSSLEGKIKIKKQPVELSQAAEKCILQLESLAYDKGVVLEADIPKGVSVLGEASTVEQIIGGLIDNAIKYEPEGGRVEITLARSRKKARLTVQNRGSFIPESDLAHIFERFYRGDKARTEGGHGLGLPILKKRAELIGADIEVKSGENEGTSFTAEFDLA